MKILIAGDGKLGATLTKHLSAEGYDLTLIDSNSQVLESAQERYDVMTIYGNCATMATLKQAGVEDANLLIAATSADEINLLCCMTAHVLNPNLHTIARIRNPEYTDQAYYMRDSFALSLTVNPERQAASEIERLLKYPGFLKRSTFAKGRVEIVELKIDEHSKLVNVPLNSMNSIVKCKVLVCAVLRDGKAFAPDGSYILREGDRIFVTASNPNLGTLLKNLDIITHRVKRVMIAGGGRVSYYLADHMQKSGIFVQIIEQNRERCEHLSAMLPNTCIVHGDASNHALLEREGINDCDALVTLTGLDELNMVISLYGHSCGVPQLITKLGRTENSKMLDTLPIGSTICPKELSCNNIVRYVRAMQNKEGAAITIHTLAEGQIEATEFVVDHGTHHCGQPLKAVPLRKNILLACIIRKNQTIIADGDSYFNEGDTVIIISNNDTVVHQLNDIFEE